MIRSMIPALMLLSQLASAYALNEVANTTMKCGSVTLRWGPDAQIVTVDGRSMDAQWGNRGIDAVIGDHDFEVQGNGKYTLDGERCVFKR